MKDWILCQEHKKWAMSNGKSIYFWSNHWVDTLSTPLVSNIIGPLNKNDYNLKASSLINNDNWHLDRIVFLYLLIFKEKFVICVLVISILLTFFYGPILHPASLSPLVIDHWLVRKSLIIIIFLSNLIGVGKLRWHIKLKFGKLV